MAKKSEFDLELNDAWFEQVGRSPAVVALTKAKAMLILAAAQSTAPVDKGDYKAGLVYRQKFSKHRVVGQVVATDWKSMLIESETGNLVKALRSVR